MGARTDKSTYCIYVHIFPNGKRYVGQTCVDPYKRWRGGKRYSGLMRKAIDKYGWDNITHEILYSGLTVDAANKIEMDLIKEFKTTNPKYGYNITKGGDGYKGAHHSGKTRTLLREKARKQWERQRAEGYAPPPITDEAREHLSKAHIGQTAWNKGKHTMTDEMKASLREARKRFWDDVRAGRARNPNSR